MAAQEQQISTGSDKAGIASAVLCMAHCLVVPVLFLMKFWVSDTAHQLPAWWEKLDYLFLVISFAAVYHSAGHTRFKEIKIALWIFWTLLACSIIFSTWLHSVAYLASAGLIAAHYINIRRIRRYSLSQ